MPKNPTYSPYLTRVTAVDNNVISLQRSYNDVLERIQSVTITADTTIAKIANSNFTNWSIIYKHKNKRDLNTLFAELYTEAQNVEL